jgi:hypothetical protein
MKTRSCAIAVLTAVAGVASATAAHAQSWTERAPSVAHDLAAFDRAVPKRYRVFDLDAAAMAERLGALSSARVAEEIVTLPTAAGALVQFRVTPSGVMAPELAAKFPAIQAFQGQQVDRPDVRVRLELTPLGFGAMVFAPGRVELVQPIATGELRRHLVFDRADVQGSTRQPCGFDARRAASPARGLPLSPPPGTKTITGETFRSYRAAVAATGEYTAHFGGTVGNAQAAIVVAMNRVNEIYQTDLGVRMVLVANNHLLVYTNALTDPYTNDDGFAMLDENQTNVDLVIGSANYDIGHVFSTDGGGVAALGAVCVAGDKAEGVTGQNNPVGDPFYVDYVAHEMGHQFGGPHTFNGTTGSCDGNRDGPDAYEPGSGSTIMAYAGICGAEDLQPNSDPYFHAGSLQRMQDFIGGGAGGACAATMSGGGAAPAIDAGNAATIPAATPFTLSGSGPSGVAYRYAYEQFNLGTAAPPNTDNGTRAIFRSFNPIGAPQRTLPRLSTVLAPPALPIGEAFAATNRTLTFRLTAREQRTLAGGIVSGVTVSDDVAYTVAAAAGPFVVTAPASGASVASPFTVAWNVANTAAAPVGCADVEIALSSDNGLTFPTLLAASTPNDGSQPVSADAGIASARVRVRCLTQPFFNVNPGPFATGVSSTLFANGFE